LRYDLLAMVRGGQWPIFEENITGQLSRPKPNQGWYLI